MTDVQREFLAHLNTLAVPIFTSRPGGAGQPEFRHPPGWPNLTAERNAEQIGRQQPDDALLGLMGGRVAAVDVDPRNGGDADKVRQLLDGLGVRIYAEVTTPGGGRHFYVAAAPDLATCHRLDGWPGLDIQAAGALLFLPGTLRPKYGGRGYEIVSDHLDVLAEAGTPTAPMRSPPGSLDRRGGGEQFTVSEPWSGELPDQRQAAYLAAVLNRLDASISAMGKDSGRNIGVYNAGLTCGNFIAGAGMDEAEAVARLLDASRRNGLVHDDGARSVHASIRSAASATARRAPAPFLRRAPSRWPRSRRWTRLRRTPRLYGRRAALAAVLSQLRTWQHLPDPVHVIVALAAAATRNADGEPCWVLLVAPPSSGKTRRLGCWTASRRHGWTR